MDSHTRDDDEHDVGTIVHPLMSLDKCFQCGITEKLRVCSRCALTIYCSIKCQVDDWKTHKVSCEFRYKIDLCIFYPFIAYLVEHHKFANSIFFPFNVHSAMRRRVAKAPIQGSWRGDGKDSPIRHTVVLGDHFEAIGGVFDLWWERGCNPGSNREMESWKFYKRACRETRIPETIVSVSLALLVEVYSIYHNLGGPPEARKLFPSGNRYRLQYKNAPISDFGVCRGRIRGGNSRLQIWSYRNRGSADKTTVHDPENYYWMYFTTITGEELTLDCSAFSFGMEATVEASPYIEKLPQLDEYALKGCKRLPAYFRSPSRTTNEYVLVEEKRFSVMKNEDIPRVFNYDRTKGEKEDSQGQIHRALSSFFYEVVGGRAGKAEADLMIELFVSASEILSQALYGKHWADWHKPRLRRGDSV